MSISEVTAKQAGEPVCKLPACFNDSKKKTKKKPDVPLPFIKTFAQVL